MKAGAKSIGMAIALCSMALILFGCDQRLPEKKRPGSASLDLTAKKSTSLMGRKVLLVHSYHPEYPWVHEITEGVRHGLKGSGVVMDVFYMDTKRRTDEAWKIKSGELARQKVREWRPDVVITADDNAQQYFGLHYVDKKLPIVFCGVNSDPSKYGYPARNVTGVIERPLFNGTVAFAGHFKPIEQVAILSSDDPTSRGAFSYIKQIALDFELVEFRLVSDFDSWKRSVREFNDSVDALGIYMYHTITEKGSPGSLAPETVMEWTMNHTAIPTLGFFDFGVRDGLMTGIVASGYEHGERAARYALDVLEGARVSSLPVVMADMGVKMLNTHTAKRLGLDLSDFDLDYVMTVPEK